MKLSHWMNTHAVSLVGKTVAVTGTTGGLGRPLCRYLAQMGADLILLDRHAEKSAAWREELRAAYPQCRITCVTLDLEDRKALYAAIAVLNDTPLDIFIHNAGAYSIPRYRCDSGFDNVFQINFAAPYTMIRELLPLLRARRGHVVVVGSIAHTYTHLCEQDVDFSTQKAASKAYGNAKRFLMFSLYELFRFEHDVTLAVTHPGITFTNITAHYPKPLFAVIKHPMKVLFMKPSKAALSIVQGVFEPCGYHEWIGPRVAAVWGLPKKRRLRTCSAEESRRIGDIAQTVYARMKGLPL